MSLRTISCVFSVIAILYVNKCFSANIFLKMDNKYILVSEAYSLAKTLFNQGKLNYDTLKEKALEAMDTFLDLVQIMNNEMARELRSAVIKFYKIKYFHDFTNYIISMEEMIDITEHCLVEPVDKLDQIRSQFHRIIQNFEDIRNFETVDKCYDQLPDEVSAAHCILHQAVLFNETMQESLVTIVTIKTRQYAQDMNASIYNVQKCLNYFVPKFYEQLLVNAYTNNCGYLKVVNASITDLINDKWKNNATMFPKKWSPLTNLLKNKLKPSKQIIAEPLISEYFSNLTSNNNITS